MKKWLTTPNPKAEKLVVETGVLVFLFIWFREDIWRGLNKILLDPMFTLFFWVGVIYGMVRLWQYIEKEVRGAGKG